MNTKAQFIQQAKQIAREEANKTVSSVSEQIGMGTRSGAQEAINAAKHDGNTEGANIDEIKRQENAKMEQLRQRLDEEIQRARQQRQQLYENYDKSMTEQFQVDKSHEQEQEPVVAPTTPKKGPGVPMAVKAKQGTGEMGRTRKG